MTKAKYVLSFLVVAAALLLMMSFIQVRAEEESSEVETTKVEKTTKKLKNGWIKQRYYKKGKYLKGLKKIKGKKYFFKKNGKITKGWKKIKKKKYFFRKKGKKGVRGSAVTGKVKIKKYWYLFNKSGTWRKKTKKVKGYTYYIDKNGHIEAYKHKKKYYKPRGKRMKSYEVSDYKTFCRARRIVKRITSKKMSKRRKLLKCFNWVRRKPYKQYRHFYPYKSWPATYANDHFVRGAGDCHSDGSAFAYLAKAIGYKRVYVCLDCNGISAQGHCWTEVNGRVYDPLFIERGHRYKYYGGSYRAYELSPILKVKIAKGYK